MRKTGSGSAVPKSRVPEVIGLLLDVIVGYSASYLSGHLARRVGLSFSRWFIGASLLPWVALPLVIWKNVRTTEFGRRNTVAVQIALWIAAIGWFALSASSILTLDL